MGVHEELRKLCDEHFVHDEPIIAQLSVQRGLSVRVRVGEGIPLCEMNIRVWLPEDWTYEPVRPSSPAECVDSVKKANEELDALRQAINERGAVLGE